MASHRRRAASNRANSLMDDYKNLRTIPAVLGMVFFATTLYQFGAVAEVQVQWWEYTLTTEHATFLGLAIYVVAFMSSETKNFQHYDTWEQALIIAGPLLIIGVEYSDRVFDWVMTTSDPWSQVVAAAIVLVGYGVAVQ